MGTVHSELRQNGPCDHMVRALPASLSSPVFLWPGMSSGAFQRTLSSNLSGVGPGIAASPTGRQRGPAN